MKGQRSRFSTSTWKRLLLALPVSVLAHILVVLVMRPDYRDVADFAVDFQVVEVTPGTPKKGKPDGDDTPKPEPEPTPESIPEPEPPKKVKVPSVKRSAKKTMLKKATKTPEKVVQKGVEEGIDAGVGSGICLHDLFTYSDKEPTWSLYLSMASFRETVFQKEFGHTFESFDLGRRLTRYMGMNLAEEVEALFVSSDDIFDWRSFRIVASYDSGEEKLKNEMARRLKDKPDFKWRKTGTDYVGMVPGEFKWRLMGSGRVVSVAYAPPLQNPKAGPAVPIPDNPFDEDGGVGNASQIESSPANKWPKEVPCIDVKRYGTIDKQQKSEPDIATLSKGYLTPDEEGHFPVALLTTTDARAVGIGRRLGRKLGFRHAVFRGYFTDPVRIEGVLSFGGDEKAVEWLAQSWSDDAKQFARNPILAVAGVSHLLENLAISAEGKNIRVQLKLTPRQVQSSLLFLQLQGKALERQLKAKQ